MARIKIEDLPVLEDLSAREIKGIFGGVVPVQRDKLTQVMESGVFWGHDVALPDVGEDITYTITVTNA